MTRILESCVDPNPLMVERQDPDNSTRFQTRERCALEIATYVFKELINCLSRAYFTNIVTVYTLNSHSLTLKAQITTCHLLLSSAEKMANRVDPFEQSDLGLHRLPLLTLTNKQTFKYILFFLISPGNLLITLY